MSDSPSPAEDPVLQGGDAADAAEQDAPASDPPADGEADPNEAEEQEDIVGGTGGEVAAATAAAAAVAARLVASHQSGAFGTEQVRYYACNHHQRRQSTQNFGVFL
jgi:hypothetical protein